MGLLQAYLGIAASLSRPVSGPASASAMSSAGPPGTVAHPCKSLFSVAFTLEQHAV